MAFCSACGTPIPDGSTVCSSCSAKAAATVTVPATGSDLADNIAGALAYVTFIPAIVFLVMEPYNKRKFVRFHAFQCIFLVVVLIVLNYIVAALFIHDLWSGMSRGFAMLRLVHLAEFILWVFLLVKAYQGQMFKLPVIGDLAEKQAGS